MTTAPEPMANGDEAALSPRRLHRSSNNKVVAGIAGGLGDRFDIDANIFRVLFVVLTFFWGLGAAIYLAMWVFVPRSEDGEISEGQRIHPPVSTSHRLTVGLLAGVVVFLIMLALLIVGGPVRTAGPSLALLWLVFLVALAVVALRTTGRRLTIRRLFAVVFLTGLSVLILVVGTFVGFLASTGVPMSGGNGAHVWQPTSINDVRHEYRTQFGATTVDLGAVNFPASGFRISASTAVGSVRVVVPANAVVNVTTHVGIGSSNYVVGSREVINFSMLPSRGLSTVQLARAPHLSIDAQVGIGRVTIVRTLGAS
ncbi:MAG TPA: PspC domain-containing protein [Acidimicrobiales bacterium]|nr:PspC domain-containing protein [Acidimicrobiales bacterium]